MTKNSTQPKDKQPDPRKIIVDGAASGIDTSVLLADIIDRFNGPSGLAAAIHQEFINAKTGSMVRTRTIEMINRLVMANTQMELSSLKKPADLDDDELKAIASSLLRKREAESGREANEQEEAADTA